MLSFHSSFLSSSSHIFSVTILPPSIFGFVFLIKIPASVEKIGENAFLDSEKVEIITPKNSYAEKYAKENNIPYQNE